jgi:hypothetical protein
MRTNFRALNVESVEDRSLPSSFFMFAAPTSAHAAPTVHNQPYVTFATATWEARAITAEGAIVNVRFYEPIVVIHQSYWYGSSEGYNTAQSSRQAPIISSSNDNGRNADSGTSAEVGSSTGPTIAPAQAVNRVQNSTPSNVSISVPADSNGAAAPVIAGQAAAAAVQAVAISSTQMQMAATSPISAGRVGGYTNTALVGPTDAVAVPLPPSSSEPPLAPAPTPAEESEVPAAPATSDPISGLLPIDLSTLQATASQFLGRVADLAPVWPDEMPSVSNSLWMAAIGVLGGGAIYAATNRPARPARDAFGSASALSEWERRNARAAG